MRRIHRGLTALACALLAVLATATGAHADGNRVLAEQASSPARADGADAIAWFAAPGTLQPADGHGALASTVDLSGGCLAPPTQLDLAGGGQLLFRCSTEHDFWFGRFPADEPRLLDLSTRAVHVPAGVVEEWYADLDEPVGAAWFNAVGRQGVQMAAYTYHAGTRDFAIDWRSGARVDFQAAADRVFDVDAPGLVTTLCEPLRQTRWDVPFTGVTDPPPYFDPLLYEAPYGVSWGLRSALTLQRCGESAAQVLEPRPPHGRMLRVVQLSGGFVSWLARDITRVQPPASIPLRAYLPSCGVRVERPVSLVSGDELSPQIAHARDALVVSEQAARGGPWRISRLPLSGVCAQTDKAWSLSVRAGRRTTTLHAAPGATQRLVNRGWRATRLASTATRDPRLAVRDGATLGLYETDAHAIRWRLGRGPWHALREAPNGWRLDLPQHLAGQRLTLRVRTRQGGTATYALRLTPRR